MSRPSTPETTPPTPPSHTTAAPRQPLTEELLDRLLASDDPDTYLDKERIQDHGLTGYLWMLLRESGLSRTRLAGAAGINAQYVHDIFEGKTKKPSRDYIIRLAIGLRCGLRNTQRLLRLSGLSELYCRQKRDAIIIWCVTHGLDLPATDEELHRLGEPTLTPKD